MDWVLIRLWRRDGTRDDALRFWAEVRDNRFSVELQPRPADEGMYVFEVFVFWTDAGPQSARAKLAPVVVD